MNSHEIEDKLIDYLDDALTAEGRAEVEQILATSPKIRQTLEELKIVMHSMDNAPSLQPSNNLKNNFDSFLQKTIANQAKEKNHSTKNDTGIVHLQKSKNNPFRIFLQVAAAAAILLLGIFVGRNMPIEKPVSQEQFATLESKMLQLLEKEKSTSARIKAVNISYELQNPNSEIIDALIQTMNIDKSTNVRMAAMEALYEFADNPKVRTALCETLRIQTNPMIQISIIKTLVHLKEEKAVEYFENLIEENDTNEEVKDVAQMAIFKMM
ncbi:MAG TPA: hypothetical protein ENJ53_07600 [Phaeodactylibacter sp.]|nr:hypothetical protein [Phaeodactylibacter sp.]